MSETKYELLVCEWQGQPRCVYLNNYRICGSKPWGGGDTLAKWNVSVEDIERAIPDFQDLKRQLEERSDTASPESQSQPDTNNQELVEAAEKVVTWKDAIETCAPELGACSRDLFALRSALLKIKGSA